VKFKGDKYFVDDVETQLREKTTPRKPNPGEKIEMTSNISKCVCAQSVNKISMQNLKDTRIFVNEVKNSI
jgi:hypothetical protein